MKRSAVNEILREARDFIAAHGFHLPPFAFWTPGEMRARAKSDAATIRARALGWDITDYGEGRFGELGLVLFTLRNGSLTEMRNGTGMLYAEKLLISDEGQISPMHRHHSKTEDIINRAGATLVLELYAAGADGTPDESAAVEIMCDGIRRVLPAGGRLALRPGESVTLTPNIWHAFRGEGGKVLIGEVSTVNDDRRDNWFREPVGRFSTIEEDAPPIHLLVSDYDEWLG